MKAISNLKRAGYTGSALVLALAAVPVIPNGSAWADDTCAGPTTNLELKTALNAGGNVTLCADIVDGGVNVNSAVNTTLDLNGHTLTAAGGSTKALIIGSSASVTVLDSVGNGGLYSNSGASGALATVNGRLVLESGDYAGLINVVGGSLVVDGGTFEASGPIFGLGRQSGTTVTETITINDGAFAGASIANRAYAENSPNDALTINDGDFRGITSAITKSNSLMNYTTINDGVFGIDPSGYEANGLEVYSYSDTADYWKVGAPTTISTNNVLMPLDASEPVEFFRVSPAEMNRLEYVVKRSSGATEYPGDVTITTNVENGEIVGYVKGVNGGRKEIDVNNNSGKTGHSRVQIYQISGVEDQVIAKNDSVTMNIASDKWNVGWRLISSSDESVAEIAADEKTVNGLASGTSTITVEFDDTVHTQRTFEVSVYDFEEGSDTLILKKGNKKTVDTDSSWSITPESDDLQEEKLQVTSGTAGKYTLKGIDAGKVNLTFSTDLDGRLTTPLSKAFKVYVYDVQKDVLLQKDVTLEESDINDIIKKGSDDVTLSFVKFADATIAENEGNAITGKKAGETKVTYKLSVDGKKASPAFNLHVWDFVTEGIEEDNTYDLGNMVSTSDSFTIYDEGGAVTYAVKDASGAPTDEVVVNDLGNGEYSLSIVDGAAPGAYTVEFVDTVLDQEVARKEITVQVHSINIVGDSENYIVLTRDPRNQSQNRIEVNVTEANGFTARSSIRANVATGLSGVNPEYRHGGNWRVTGEAAGAYEVIFDDGVASASIKVYVINFTFGQDSYHVRQDEGRILIETINNYWQEINAAEGRYNTDFVMVNDETGEEVTAGFTATPTSIQGRSWNFEWDDALAPGNYTITFKAYANGTTATKSVRLHTYEMIKAEPIQYAETGDTVYVGVGDLNDRAHLGGEITVIDGEANGLRFATSGWGWSATTDYTRLVASAPGVYRVHYVDYMPDGTVVDECDMLVVVIDVVEETLLVRKGQTIEITGNGAWAPSVAVDDESGVDYVAQENSDGEMVILFDATNATLGEHTVWVAHDFTEFEPEDSGRPAARLDIKKATVIVYSLESDDKSEPAGVTADTIQAYLESLVAEGKIGDLLNSRTGYRLRRLAARDGEQALFGEDGYSVLAGLQNAINNQLPIETFVQVNLLDEDAEIDEGLLAVLESLGAKNVVFYDASVIVTVDGNSVGKLHELNNKITVALCEVTNPADGYARSYIVVRHHEGETPEVQVLTEGVDFYIQDGWLYVISDKFSTYAVAYEDTLIPVTYTVSAPETGANTATEDNMAQSSLSVIVTAVSLMSAIALAGAIKASKRQ
ncbi:hypothetical protein IJF93_02480 [Candidatus Saccharibacteria bacterium]|nr:hypothetical protein [Candidatus Saccharibacteria bacterium]